MNSLITICHKFKRKAFTIRSFAEAQDEKAASGADMHRVLGPFDLIVLGIGCIIGAGDEPICYNVSSMIHHSINLFNSPQRTAALMRL